jgi:hypothetical protein
MNADPLRGPAALMFLILACASSPAPQPHANACDSALPGGATTTRARLVAVKAEVMSADYRADLEALARGRDEALACANDTELGYLAHYWAGYASWRAAMNGANRHMKRDDLVANLQRARADFETSLSQRSDSADAYAAAASVNGWLGGFFLGDRNVAREHFDRSSRFLSRALELEPANPRVMWVEAGDLLFRPLKMGGDPPRAIEIYRHAIATAPEPDGASPLPDWGKPECLMALAFAHLNSPSPDAAAAATEAREALRMQPDWSYVRDILLPQIEKAR